MPKALPGDVIILGGIQLSSKDGQRCSTERGNMESQARQSLAREKWIHGPS